MQGEERKDVTDSCGCVFCDVELPVRIIDSNPMHEVSRTRTMVTYEPCTRGQTTATVLKFPTGHLPCLTRR